MQQLAVANSIKTALIGALTEREQINLSKKIMGNVELLPQMFITWVKTEEGKLAVRAMVDKFTGVSE
jgi:hypothetical protein